MTLPFRESYRVEIWQLHDNEATAVVGERVGRTLLRPSLKELHERAQGLADHNREIVKPIAEAAFLAVLTWDYDPGERLRFPPIFEILDGVDIDDHVDFPLDERAA